MDHQQPSESPSSLYVTTTQDIGTLSIDDTTYLSIQEKKEQKQKKKQENIQQLKSLERKIQQINQQIEYQRLHGEPIQKLQEEQIELQHQCDVCIRDHDNENDVEVPEHYKTFLASLTSPSRYKKLNVNKTEEIKQYLIENKDYINYCDKKGHTILRIAIELKSLPLIKLLIENNVNLKHQDELMKYSILQFSLYRLNYEGFKLLVENVDMVVILSQDYRGYTVLMDIADQRFENSDMFSEHIKLLLGRGVNVHTKNHNNETAAHLCIKRCKWNYLDLLIKYGATKTSVPQYIFDYSLQYAIYTYSVISLYKLKVDYGVRTFFHEIPKGTHVIDTSFNSKCIADNDRNYIKTLSAFGVFSHPLVRISFMIDSYEALKTTAFYNTLVQNGFCDEFFDIKNCCRLLDDGKTEEKYVEFVRKQH